MRPHQRVLVIRQQHTRIIVVIVEKTSARAAVASPQDLRRGASWGWLAPDILAATTPNAVAVFVKLLQADHVGAFSFWRGDLGGPLHLTAVAEHCATVGYIARMAPECREHEQPREADDVLGAHRVVGLVGAAKGEEQAAHVYAVDPCEDAGSVRLRDTLELQPGHRHGKATRRVLGEPPLIRRRRTLGVCKVDAGAEGALRRGRRPYSLAVVCELARVDVKA
eukprot:scaffold5638_cov63-Phaeocystis_antarctica.AAC.1